MMNSILSVHTQNAATIGMLQFLYLWAPVIICGVVMLLLTFLKVEQANKKLLAEKVIAN